MATEISRVFPFKVMIFHCYVSLPEGIVPTCDLLMLRVDVALPSGKKQSLEVPRSSTVGHLKRLAQTSLGQRFLQLVTAAGLPLDPMTSLEAAGLQDGDQLTALAQQVKMAATEKAFALWCCGGRIVTWGNPRCGGDISAVQHWLGQSGVRQVQASSGAFAALLADGSVVTWGKPEFGGDSSKVQEDLEAVAEQTFLSVPVVNLVFGNFLVYTA